MSTEKVKKGLRLPKFGKKKEDNLSKLNLLWNGDQMPYPLQSCFAFLYYFNIDVVHILRKSGNKIAHDVLLTYLKKNHDVAPTFYINSVFDVSSALKVTCHYFVTIFIAVSLKAYTRDIPDGLLAKDLRHDWHKLVQYNNEAKVREKLSVIILKLPLANRNMLFYLLFLSSKISENRLKNEMSTKSVSIILMPTMFERVVDIRKCRYLYAFYDLLEFMIDNAASLIGKELYDNIESRLTDIGRHLQIINQIKDEPDIIEEDKRIQFVSQDSGLNSSSFIDDKSCLSQSTNNEANATFDQSVLSDQNISSMEDLLNNSDATSDISDKNNNRRICRSSTIVNDQSVAVPPRERTMSDQSTSSEDIPSESHCTHRWQQQCKVSSHTCTGLKPHSIKECRPYSICGSPNISEVLRPQPCQHISSQSNIYAPVYDRSFQKMDSGDDGPSRYSSKFAGKAVVSCARTIKKKKPVLKRSSCIIVPMEPGWADTRHIATSCSLNTHYQSPINDSVPVNAEQTKLSPSIVNQKPKIKKKSFLFRSRLSVPINIDEQQVTVHRTISVQKSDNPLTSLPQPLATYLRQRSSDETFV